MQARYLGRIPVVDSQARLAGIVSRADLLSVFERPDELIRDQVITEVIAARFGLNPQAFKVAVSSGHVPIAGPVEHRAVALPAAVSARVSDEVRPSEGTACGD